MAITVGMNPNTQSNHQMKVNQVNYPWFLRFSAYHFQSQPPFSSSPLWRVDRPDHSARSCCFPPGFRRHLRLIKDTPAVSESNGWMTKWKMAIANIWIVGDSILDLYWIFTFFFTHNHTWSALRLEGHRPGTARVSISFLTISLLQVGMFGCGTVLLCVSMFPPLLDTTPEKKSHESNICTVYIYIITPN